jgi:hypothetical protein
MRSALTQSVVIAISFISVFLWKESELALYTVPALGILTSFYLIATMRKSRIEKAGTKVKSNALLIVFLLNTSSLLLIQATGGLHSVLFFLLYFLAFYISFMLQAETVFLFTGAVLFFFLPEAATGDTLANTAKIASFLLLSPLAYFFGKEIVLHERQLKKTNVLKEDTQATAERIIKDVSDIVKNEGKTLKEDDLAKLHDIVEESRQLEKEAE